MKTLSPFPGVHEAHSARTVRLTRAIREPVTAGVGAVVTFYRLRGGDQALYVLDEGQRVLVSRYRAAAGLNALLDTWCATGQAVTLTGGHETTAHAGASRNRRAGASW